jgi:hypothetical protein
MIMANPLDEFGQFLARLGTIGFAPSKTYLEAKRQILQPARGWRMTRPWHALGQWNQPRKPPGSKPA